MISVYWRSKKEKSHMYANKLDYHVVEIDVKRMSICIRGHKTNILTFYQSGNRLDVLMLSTSRQRRDFKFVLLIRNEMQQLDFIVYFYSMNEQHVLLIIELTCWPCVYSLQGARSAILKNVLVLVLHADKIMSFNAGLFHFFSYCYLCH